MAGKLRALGFRPLTGPSPPYLFGGAPLMGGVCEEAELLAFETDELATAPTMAARLQPFCATIFGLLALYAVTVTVTG